MALTAYRRLLPQFSAAGLAVGVEEGLMSGGVDWKKKNKNGEAVHCYVLSLSFVSVMCVYNTANKLLLVLSLEESKYHNQTVCQHTLV